VQNFQPVDLRQIQVQEHDIRHDLGIAVQIGTIREQKIQRLLPIGSNDYFAKSLALFESAQGQLGIVGLSSTSRMRRLRIMRDLEVGWKKW